MTDREAQTNRAGQRKSRVVWFEIPASNFDRAVKFYQSILQVTLKLEQEGPAQLAIFAYQPPAISGCVIAGKGYTPGTGAIVYLNADPDLQAVLDRVAGAGGKVLVPRTALPEAVGGYFARILDTEGNQVGLHAVS
ncbi:MAG: VOC family protein [Acidobacteriaceae bacterium]